MLFGLTLCVGAPQLFFYISYQQGGKVLSLIPVTDNVNDDDDDDDEENDEAEDHHHHHFSSS